jgi:hypothetical protein
MKTDKHLNQRLADLSIKRIKSLLLEEPNLSYIELAEILNSEGHLTIRQLPWNANNLRQVVFKLRKDMNSYYGLSANRARFTPTPVAA